MSAGTGRSIALWVTALALAGAGASFAQAPRPPGTAAPGTEIDVTDIPDRFLTPEGRRLKEEKKGGGKPGGAGAQPAAPGGDLVESIPDEFLSPEGRRRKAERAAQRAGLDPGGLPAIDTSDAATKNAQSLLDAAKQIIPPSDADLEQIESHAKAIQALSDACQGAKCPIVQDCATATALLQELINADAYLNAALGALNRASADAAQAHNNVVAQTRITSTNLSIATEALGVKQYFYRLATMLFDLASVADDLKGMAEKGSLAPGDNWAQKLDTAYETLKDLESLAGDVTNAANDYSNQAHGTNVEAPNTSVMSGPTGAALGVSPNTMSGLNDLKSNLSDAANTFDEVRKQLNDPKVKEGLKSGKVKPGDLLGGPAKALSKIVFRDLKVLVEKQIRALEAQIADLTKNLSAEEKVLAGLFESRMRIVSRRDAASDALAAVRRARASLSACLARACGPASLTRPVIPDYYAPPPGMSPFDLAPHYGWGTALKDLNPKLAASAIALAKRFTVRDYCPPGGGTFVDPGGGGGISTGPGGVAGPTGEGTGLPPRNVVTTECPPCKPIADHIGRILDAIETLRAENAEIERHLSQLPTLEARRSLQEKFLAKLRAQAQALRDAIRSGNVLGLNVAGSARQSLTLLEAQIVAVQGEVRFLENEIRRLEGERRQLERNKARIAELHAERRALRKKLRTCEEDLCRRGYWVETDTVINIGGNNPFNPVDPLGPTTTPPGTPGDDRPLATVTIKSHTAEGGAPGAFTVTLTKPSPSNFFVVNYTLTGSATLGADYAAVTAGAPVPMGQTTFDVTVTPIDDNAQEGTETVQLTLMPGEGYALGVPSTAIMTITDNDGAPPQQPGSIQLSASTYQTAEGQGAVTITATRTGGTSGQVTVGYNTGPSSATPGQDYSPVDGILAWGDGDATVKTFTVPIADDSLVEGPETFFVTIANPTGGATLGSPSTASVTIADNDVATGPCGAQGHAWAGNPGTYNCSGSCSPTPTPQTLTVNGDQLTLSPFHAGGAATFQGCSASLVSQSNTLTYFGQSNHTATITRSGNNAFNANIVSSGGGTCFFSCSR
ncbi:MAG: Calx-beta domain-containing protein [Burkholderiales bacterium]